jgi:hypothetical protein
MLAQRAIQVIGVDNVVELETINAALPFDAQDIATVTAPGGTYDRDKNSWRCAPVTPRR